MIEVCLKQLKVNSAWQLKNRPSFGPTRPIWFAIYQPSDVRQFLETYTADKNVRQLSDERKICLFEMMYVQLLFIDCCCDHVEPILDVFYNIYVLLDFLRSVVTAAYA
ncbi:conserved hypothetical protein [Trichinella spiralis]|uniref:hypothetical protein n=1 Tax=Trichinella spiralis TaxID=6334 RepID=UPI0001EFBF47|nr:conserved hypothetical protein [Trichinella spiralis]